MLKSADYITSFSMASCVTFSEDTKCTNLTFVVNLNLVLVKINGQW